jgi:hypothetical protein
LCCCLQPRHALHCAAACPPCQRQVGRRHGTHSATANSRRPFTAIPYNLARLLSPAEPASGFHFMASPIVALSLWP